MSDDRTKKDFIEEVELTKPIIEAMIFSSKTPVTVRHIVEALNVSMEPVDSVSSDVIKTALSQLKEEYKQSSRGICLMEISGGHHFRTKPQYKEYIVSLTKARPVKLSPSALETLAIIAYKQPIIKAEIEDIRGVDSGYIVRSLLEKKLIRIVGRKDIAGRPLIYSTTHEFLEVFSLKDLSDLPTLKDIKELGKSELDDSQLSFL